MNRILKDEILNRIEQPCITGGWHEVSGEVTANAIQQALNKYCNVSIPYLDKPIVLDEPIVLSSNNHLKADSRQVFLQGPTSNKCLVPVSYTHLDVYKRQQ